MREMINYEEVVVVVVKTVLLIVMEECKHVSLASGHTILHLEQGM